MNSREFVLVSTATVFGALTSALAFRLFFFNPRKQLKKIDSSHQDIVPENDIPPCPFNPSKRNGYLTWDDYFMAIAFLSAERSKDPNRQVGACLVSQNGIILGKFDCLQVLITPENLLRTLNITTTLHYMPETEFCGRGIGYNGFPRGCSDDKLPWAKKSKTNNPLETKYPYVCHAEVNAILNTNHASAAGQRLYVTMFPCNECAKIIIQSGVSEVIYFVEKRLNNSDTAYIASHKLLSLAGVKVRKHQPQMKQILIKFEDP